VNLILRTSWVYSMRQGGFVTKVLQWAREQEVMRVVDDQISSPTSARMLAEISALILAKIDGMVLVGQKKEVAFSTLLVTALVVVLNGQKKLSNLIREKRNR